MSRTLSWICLIYPRISNTRTLVGCACLGWGWRWGDTGRGEVPFNLVGGRERSEGMFAVGGYACGMAVVGWEGEREGLRSSGSGEGWEECGGWCVSFGGLGVVDFHCGGDGCAIKNSHQEDPSTSNQVRSLPHPYPSPRRCLGRNWCRRCLAAKP